MEPNGKKAASKKTRSKTAKTKTAVTPTGMSLVVVESPAKAKTINKYLGRDFLVEASMGHVRDLPKSKMGVDIEHNFEPHYIIVSKARKTVSHLKKVAKGMKCIYLAPDPDREGEAISWHLAHIFKEIDAEIPIRRVVFNEITKEAVKKAFDNTREIKMPLVDAQQARRILDRVVGYELSPLLWKKIGKGLSAGRVQSVALRLIVERERAIRKFVPEEYWSLEAKLASQETNPSAKSFIAKFEKIGEEKADLNNREQTKKVRDEVLKLPFKVHKIEKKERKRKPQAPYTTSKLQQEAYNRLGFPAAKTMRLAQGLYEGVDIGDEGSVGLITYMRTDSVNIALSAQQEAAEFIRTRFGAAYLPEAPPIYRSKKGAQEAHEAIRPSGVSRDPESVRAYLSEDHLKLYSLIWKKFVASQMTPAADEHMTIWTVSGDNYFFKTTGKRNLFRGFTAAFEDFRIKPKEGVASSEEGEEVEPTEMELPELHEGELLNLLELLGHQHFTKPPGRYNDASLVKVLEEKGIGRPSTYAPTIMTLLARDYVFRKGGALVPAELGETVIEMLVEYFPKVLDVEFTAAMEEELDKVEDGQVEWVSVLKEFYAPFLLNLNVAREQMKNFKLEPKPTEFKCKLCEKHLVEKMGRFGKFLACSGFPECKHTRSIPTGLFCPEPDCGGELVKRRSKQRRTFFGCSNYPKCTYIANKVEKKDDDSENEEDDDGPSPAKLETLGP